MRHAERAFSWLYETNCARSTDMPGISISDPECKGLTEANRRRLLSAPEAAALVRLAHTSRSPDDMATGLFTDCLA
jgi:hypothetical protein